jgi:hypothetical protein
MASAETQVKGPVPAAGWWQENIERLMSGGYYKITIEDDGDLSER